VNSTLKSLVFWVVLVVVGLVIWNFSTKFQQQPRPLDFSAFMVPVSGGVQSPTTETATRAWDAIALHPFPPTDFSGGGFGNLRTHVASFLIFDPQNGRAGVSGITTSLRNPGLPTLNRAVFPLPTLSKWF